jgi:DNA-binding NtrC family response regulator
VLRYLDQMSTTALRELDSHLHSVSGPDLWVVGTVHPDTDVERRLGRLLTHFTESVSLPPLRHRIEDIRELVPQLLQRHAPGRGITVGPDAMQILLRGSWPGNIAELDQAIHNALARRHTGQITVADLPESCHATSRRVLSEWESLERDAIIRALKESGGDKIKAAVRLGISRATVYRKIRMFGIVIGPDAEQGEAHPGVAP